jgi:hypothetical protein
MAAFFALSSWASSTSSRHRFTVRGAIGEAIVFAWTVSVLGFSLVVMGCFFLP